MFISVINSMESMTVKDLKEYATSLNITIPSKASKSQMIAYINGMLATRASDSTLVTITATEINSVEPVYVDTSIDWLEHLHIHGWSVVPIEGWSDTFTSSFFSWLEHCAEPGQEPKFKRDDVTTWKRENMPPMLHGIFKHYLGHTEFQWQIRELCLPYFQRIWGTDDLLSSFDGGCLLYPCEKQSKFKQWIHCDQPRDTPGFCCVQGIVNFVDCDEEDGGLLLLDGSSKIWDNYMQRHPAAGIFWQPADLNDCELVNCKPIKVCAPAGSLILFDSRMMHCNTNPIGSVMKAGVPRFRMCTYVSMQPRSGASDKELKRRISAYEKGRLTGHWCYGPWFSLNAEHGFRMGTKVLPITNDIATLNPLRSKLIGYPTL